MEKKKCFFFFFCFLVETNDGKRSFLCFVLFLNLQHAQWWCGWKQMMSPAWLNQSGISVIEKRMWSVIRFVMLNWWWINRRFFLSEAKKLQTVVTFCRSKKNESDFFLTSFVSFLYDFPLSSIILCIQTWWNVNAQRFLLPLWPVSDLSDSKWWSFRRQSRVGVRRFVGLSERNGELERDEICSAWLLFTLCSSWIIDAICFSGENESRRSRSIRWRFVLNGLWKSLWRFSDEKQRLRPVVCIMFVLCLNHCSLVLSQNSIKFWPNTWNVFCMSLQACCVRRTCSSWWLSVNLCSRSVCSALRCETCMLKSPQCL